MKRILFLFLFVMTLFSAACAEETLIPPLDAAKAYPSIVGGYTSDTHYQDDTLEVSLTTDRYLDCDIWIAEVRISNPGQIRSAFCGAYTSGKTAGADKIARRVGAVLACNGDYCNFHPDTGVVIRNGKQYRKRPNKKNDVLLIDTSGTMRVVVSPTKDSFNAVYDEMGGPAETGGTILHALTFGPALIQNGEFAHDHFVRPDNGHRSLAQRMVIAQREPMSFLLIACSGPESRDSRGMTLDEMAQYVMTLDVTTAYNLDGGSSATLVFDGEKINSLDTGKTRAVSDILYFSSAVKPS